MASGMPSSRSQIVTTEAMFDPEAKPDTNEEEGETAEAEGEETADAKPARAKKAKAETKAESAE